MNGVVICLGASRLVMRIDGGVRMEQPGDTGVVGAPDRCLHNEKSHLFTPLCLTDVLIFNGHRNKIKARKHGYVV